MVKYCDGIFCKKKKRRVRQWRYLNGVSNTKLAPLTHSNNVVVSNTKSIDPMIAAFGGSEKFITSNPKDQLYNAYKGIGSAINDVVGGYGLLKGGLKLARGIAKIPWRQMYNTWKRSPYETLADAMEAVHWHGRSEYRNSSMNRDTLNWGLKPSSVSPAKTPRKLPWDANAPLPKYLQGPHIPEPVLQGAGKMRVAYNQASFRGPPAHVYNPKSLNFELNRWSEVPKRVKTFSQNMAKPKKTYLPFDNVALSAANEFNEAVGDPHRYAMGIEKITGTQIMPLVKYNLSNITPMKKP